MNYATTYRWSTEDPEGFWAAAAGAVDWSRSPTIILDLAQSPTSRWFTDGVLNTCYNALDRHVISGRADQPALIYDSPVSGTLLIVTYRELLANVVEFSKALREQGVRKGDRVVIYMSIVPEAVVAMLACARLGAVHSVVFGGFGAPELASRIDAARPKVIVSTSCGLDGGRIVDYKALVDRARDLASHELQLNIVLQRPQLAADLEPGRDLDWVDAVRAGHSQSADPVDVGALDPLYILYTSGTSGGPKGVVRDNGGHAVALQWSMKNIYDIGAGDVWWAASDIGWVVGHSYMVYAPLMVGATTVLYEGKPVGTPNAGAFWRVVQEHGVRGLFAAPTALRAIKREDPDGALARPYDLASLRHLFLAGERLDPDTYAWAGQVLSVPIVDHWWQTETGWPIAASPRGLERMPTKPGSASVPVPGFDVRVLDVEGREVPAGQEGAIVIKFPLPPGTTPTLWEDDARFESSYLAAYDGFYLTGDGGYFDDDGYLYVMGRTDDIINVAGHRLSTGAIEAILSTHPAVAECAVIGVADPVKGQVPRGLVVLKGSVTDQDPSEVEAALIERVRETLGPVASFKSVSIVPGLPKTRSGKILRKTMREIADGRSPTIPSTIEDPAVLELLMPLLRRET